MDSATAARLIELNRDFYTHFGDSFSATRHRIQPGVRRVMEGLHGDESILDLGCGNGEFARELAKRGHRGAYLAWTLACHCSEMRSLTLERFLPRSSKLT